MKETIRLDINISKILQKKNNSQQVQKEVEIPSEELIEEEEKNYEEQFRQN